MNATENSATEQHRILSPAPVVAVVNGDNVDNGTRHPLLNYLSQLTSNVQISVDVKLDDVIPDSQTDVTTSLKSEILDSASTRVEISTPIDPGSCPSISIYLLLF